MSNLNNRIAEIVTALEREGKLGERFNGHTPSDEVRFGTHGSLSVIVRGSSRGNWYNHESQVGGGPRELIAERGGPNINAWLRHHRLVDKQPETRVTYDYTDERGALLFQVVRFPNHQFRQRKPDGQGMELETRRHPPRAVPLAGTDRRQEDRQRASLASLSVRRRKRRRSPAPRLGRRRHHQSRRCPVLARRVQPVLRWRQGHPTRNNDQAGRERSAKLAPQLARAGAIVRVIRFPELPAKGDISDWLNAGGTQSLLDNIIENTEPFHLNGHDPGQATQAQAEPPAWILDRLNRWADRLIPARQWIMEDWIPRGQTTGLYGVSGVYKSTFLIQLMMAAAAGLLLLRPADHRGAGLWLVLRGHRGGGGAPRDADCTILPFHFSRFGNFHFASLVGVMGSELLSFEHDGYKFGPAYGLLENQLATLRPGLVILDTLPDFFGGDEINRRQTLIFIRMLDALSIRFECAIVCAAHPSMRGR